jgi:phosphate transport system permease protein
MQSSRTPPVTLLGADSFSVGRILSQGEPLIWLAGAAVAVVLFMISLMLAIVFLEGATFFWPRPVQQLSLQDGTRLAGIQRDAEIFEQKDDEGKVLARTPRIQLLVGNRDLTGEDFVWVDLPQVVQAERPKGVYYIERQEWGPMIAWPVSMSRDGVEIRAEDPGFAKAFQAAIRAGRRRHDEIVRIERDEIGHLNHQLEDLRLKRRSLELAAQARGKAVDAARLQALQKRGDALQEDFKSLQEQLSRLRRADEAETVTFRTLAGQEKTHSFSWLVRAYPANEIGFFEKLGIYLGRVFEYIFGEPRESNTEGGVFPAIFGTVMMSLIMTLAVVPFGVVAALYLREYAKQGPLTSAVRIAVNNLAGVPSIVFGVFGLGFFVYFVGGGIDRLFYAPRLPDPTFGTGGILWASLTLALLTVPVVIVATEEALAFVPKGIRDGALACGASKWQMIRTVVLPASAPGILTGVILAMARGAGEVAPLMITGVVKLAPELALDGHFPFFHPERKFMHLGFHIYDVGFQSPNVEAAMPMVYTSTLLLIGVIVALNLTAMWIRNRLKERYRSSAF